MGTMMTTLSQILTKEDKAGSKQRILVFPFNLLSHYLRCLELCDELKDTHEIIFAYSPKYERWINEKGYTTFPFTDFDAAMVMEYAVRFDFSWMEEKNLEKVFKQQVEIINHYKPHLIIGDASMTLRMASEYCSVKYIALLNGYMSKYYAFTRQLPQTHPAFKYSKKVPAFLFDKITNVAEKFVFGHVHAPFRRLRKKYGLKSKKYLPDEMEGDITLLCDLPEIFPQVNLPDNYHFIGPLYYDEPAPEPEIKSFISSGKKNILVTMGSTGNVSKLTWLAEPEYSKYNIIFSGDKSPWMNAGHICVRGFIHNTAIMDSMDVVICHGGNGTIYQALAYGVPLLASTSIFEQEYNMERIREMKLGDYLLNNEVPTNERIKQLDYWISQKNNPALRNIKREISQYRKVHATEY